jgi:uncharacterized protein YjiS (DUF1127 family)
MQIISLRHPMADGRGCEAWWRAFAAWRAQRQARAALAQMTPRALADIGMTPCDRTMALVKWSWNDPGGRRDVMTSTQGPTAGASASIRTGPGGYQYEFEY